MEPLKLLDSLSLVKAGPDEALFCADKICLVAEGLLEQTFGAVTEHLGFASVKEALAWLLNDGQGVFSLDNIELLKLQLPEDGIGTDDDGTDSSIAGLCFAYDQAQHEKLLPEIVQHMVRAESAQLLGQIMPPPAGGRSLYLNTLWVRHDLRGLHLGRLLLQSLSAQGQADGFDSIVLHCFNDNERALGFYRGLGFEAYAQISYPEGLAARHPLGGSLLSLNIAGGQHA